MKKKWILAVLFGAVFSAVFLSACTQTNTGIINVHEHLESEASAEKLLRANKEFGIVKTVLLGSPVETLEFDGREGFSGYDENNEVILNIAQKYPDDFLAFCTIYWQDTDKLAKLKDCVAHGAKGLKLYNGHGFFHTMPLDDFKMEEIYDYLEENSLPVLFHVNGGKYLTEFKNVLNAHPNLKVICPHFCLLSGNFNGMESFLDDHPNVYFDISFGYVDYVQEGFERFNKDIEKYRDFFIKYQDRLLFGTDTVVTEVDFKDEAWLKQLFGFYQAWLEEENFTFSIEKPHKIDFEVKGMHLPKEVLDKIYHENAEEFLGL